MSEIVTLSKNQKRVLIGLCNFPMNSDSYIAEKIGIKRSTFATVKKRLIDPPYSIISPINIPNFFALGAELFSISSVMLNPGSLSKHAEIEGVERILKLPNIITTFYDSDSGYVLIVSKSFSDLTYTQNLFSGYGIEQDIFSPSNINRVIIPLAYNGFARFLNYGNCFSHYWNIPLEGKNALKLIFNNQDLDMQNISPLGWKIFDSIIKYPNLSILELGKLLKKPRNTITRWIRKFRLINLYQKRFLPDLPKIGFNIHSFISIYVQGIENEKRSEIINLIVNTFHPEDIFWSYQRIFFSAVFPDYNCLREKESIFITEMDRLNFPFKMNKYTHSISNVVIVKSLRNSLSELINYLRDSKKLSLT